MAADPRLASIWEMAIQSGLGKLDLPGPLDPFVGEAFDRMLVARARTERLVTADAWIGAYDVDIT